MTPPSSARAGTLALNAGRIGLLVGRSARTHRLPSVTRMAR